jgi:hypothetical protein
MALAIVQVYARSGWRARAVYSGGNPAGAQPGDFAITRQDGGPCTVTVAAVQSADVTSLELVMSERLIPKVAYVLTWGTSATPFSWTLPAAQDPTVAAQDDDPDAEANGVDLAWISSDPGPSGDCQRRTGLACVQYDLSNLAFIVPGDLINDPAAGANLQSLVNSSSSDAEMLQAGAALSAQFRRDPRVADADVDVVVGIDAPASFNGQIKTRAGQTAPVQGS